MDRPFWWYGATLRDTDLLNASRFPMVALGKLAEALLGLPTAVVGFTLAPTAPASLSATLGPGQVYEAENLEATQWAGFGPDTHTLVKQGIALDAQNLTFVAPTTVGYAQNFLVEVQYQDIDGGSTVLPYYNAANPAVPYSGPGNAGTAQNTIRQGAVAVQVKAGIAATSGSQVSPTPDAGWAGLFIVTLAYGQTTITSGNITAYANAPFLPFTIPQIPAAIQAQAGNYAPDTGTANAMAITLPSYTPGTLPDGTPIRFTKGSNPNTSPTTIAINGTVYVVQTSTGAALSGGEIPAGATMGGLIRGGALRLGGGGTTGGARQALSTPLTVWVRTDGSDANDGSANTAAKAFATLSGAITAVYSKYDAANQTVTILCGLAGTYAGAAIPTVSGALTIGADTTVITASQFVVQSRSGGPQCIFNSHPNLTLKNLILDHTYTGANDLNECCVATEPGGNTFIDVGVTTRCNNNRPSMYEYNSFNGGQVTFKTGITHTSAGTGSRKGFLYATFNGSAIVTAPGCTFVSSGTIAYTNFVYVDVQSRIYFGQANFSGFSATGARYYFDAGSLIHTLGGGVNFFPGNAAGSYGSSYPGGYL